jgi:peptidase E
LIWFEGGITDSLGTLLRPMTDGLRFLKGSNAPHYTAELDRRPAYLQAVANGFPDGIATDDGAALHFVDEQLRSDVTSHKAAAAYSVQHTVDGGIETKLPSTYLGN